VEGGGGGLTVSGVSRTRGSFVKCVAIQKRLGIPALSCSLVSVCLNPALFESSAVAAQENIFEQADYLFSAPLPNLITRCGFGIYVCLQYFLLFFPFSFRISV
jgi:hypothetical protein